MNFLEAMRLELETYHLNEPDCCVLNEKGNQLFKFNLWSFYNGHFVEYYNIPRKLVKHEKITEYEYDIRNFAVKNICSSKEVIRTKYDKENDLFYIQIKNDLTPYEKKVIRNVIKKAGHI